MTFPEQLTRARKLFPKLAISRVLEILSTLNIAVIYPLHIIVASSSQKGEDNERLTKWAVFGWLSIERARPKVDLGELLPDRLGLILHLNPEFCRCR